MKRTLKFALVISIILALFMGNVTVLATNIMSTEPKQQETSSEGDSNNVSNEVITNAEVIAETPNNNGENETENLNSEEELNSDKETEETGENNNSNSTKSVANSGELDIQLDMTLPSKRMAFDVKLKNEQDTFYPEFYESSEEEQKVKDAKLFYTFKNITEGKYTLEIKHQGYVSYVRNDIEIKADTISKISLTNGYTDLLKDLQVGLMAVGDVNGDGKVTEEDEDEIIDAIDNHSNNDIYDLNGDETVDIIDLSYVAINKNKSVKEADILETVDTSKATIEYKEEDIQSGKIEDILQNNDKFVTLKPQDSTKDISKENPVEISIALDENIKTETKEITIKPSSNEDNNIEEGTITIVVDGVEGEEVIEATLSNNSTIKYSPVAYNISKISNVIAKVESDGTISINLGSKVAVKRITIKVTATKTNKFADIAKVEFLNGFKDRVQAPTLDIPEDLQYTADGESFTVTWENMQNVTGYQVLISTEIEKDGKKEQKSQEYSVDGNSITISDFFGAIKDRVPCTYEVAVQSVNGDWKSGYGKVLKVTVSEVTKPAPPDNVTVKGGVRELQVSWKKMNATNSYKVFYRKYEDGDYIEATKNLESPLELPSYRITDLEDNQKYQVYVIGVNTKGESDKSNIAIGETTNIEPAIMPAYRLINTPTEDGKLTSNIQSVVLKPWNTAFMVDSPLDVDENGNPIKVGTGRSAIGVVDNDYNSYLQVNDWDFGGFYHDYNTKGIEVTFDKAYKMNYFAFAQIENLGDFVDAKLWYKDMTTGKTVGPIVASQVVTKTGENGRQYTIIKLAEPIESDRVQIAVGRRYAYIGKITIAEMRFYEYDSIEDDINNLYADQLHTTLKDTVTEQTFKDLQTRLDTKDEASGEFHPEKDSLQKELDLAKLIFDTENLKDVIKIDTTVTKAKDSHITFRSGLNAWQPLGIVAHSNEVIKIFVGNPSKKNGDSTNLNLIFTQYYPEAANWHQVVRTGLKVGLNEISLPRIDSLDKESGGSLYIEYTGNNPEEQYGVRVVGGDYIPVLDLSKIKRSDYDTNAGYESARKQAVTDYVQKLTEVVPNLEQNHNEKHKNSSAKELKYDYNEKNCLLGATEIVLDQMMYSVSSKQILAGLGDGTVDEKADKLYNSLVAMEDMVDLFYQHKGLKKNTVPSSRLNIRYHQMFAGAAMYAGGLHIGIDWDDVQTLSKGNPIVTESDGKYDEKKGGNYFGWGISHEIGHIINESAYVHGEVTNNYFSVLSQAKDTNSSVRFDYREVYKKVMSGKTGKAQNVFTQLGLYWQLHLAYDKGGYNFKTFSNYAEQQENLIFARMDSYARDTSSAPKTEIALTLTDSKDDNLIRLACAAAEKNLLTFFEKWGMEPNEDTIAYARQWEEETRAVYFVNDEARAYELAGSPRMSEGTTVSATREIVTESDSTNTNKVKLTITNTSTQKAAMLGYEIVRCYMDNDVEKTTPVAFVTMENSKDGLVTYNNDNGELTYTDTIETVNNRVFTYKVTGYDKYLNKTEQFVLEPIKVEHDGTIGGKDNWTVTTNIVSEDDEDIMDKDSKKLETTDGPVTVKAASELIDNDYSKDYKGKAEKGDAEILIELDETKKLVGFKYASTEGKVLENYTVEVSKDGKEWTTVKTTKSSAIKSIFNKIFKLNKMSNNTKTVYFGEGDKLEIYDTTFVKFTIKDSNFAIAEIDLIGQTGDNVDFVKAEDGKYSGYGILSDDVTLGVSDENGNAVQIPKGSIVFTGTYKGNPAYNALKLWFNNNKGNNDELLAGSAQVFYADPVPDGAELTEVNEGIWIYYVKETIFVDENGEEVDNPKDGTEAPNPYYDMVIEAIEGKTVRAELYRVDDAHTLEGERITSDSYRIPISSSLPEITLKSNGTVE